MHTRLVIKKEAARIRTGLDILSHFNKENADHIITFRKKFHVYITS